MKKNKTGEYIFNTIKKLYPINRSITGDGNRKTLNILKSICNTLKITEFKSGSKVFDWKIPSEWSVRNAFVKFEGRKIIDFKKHNLHLVSYSKPINKTISFKLLNKHLYSIKKKPNAIPYVTSYYKKNWGFCLEHKKRSKLKKNVNYHVYIDSFFNKNGSLSIGEIYIKGKSKKEILLSTNICHPSMVNNELCGPVILAYLGQYLKKKKNYYSIRIVFFPETIGSITYLKNNLNKLKKNYLAGFHITCFGNKKEFSMVSSKYENSFSDFIAKNSLKKKKNYKIYPFKFCGSDERQYNYPGIDIPIVTLTRSKFANFNEYHTSLDNLKITNPKTLEESFDFLKRIIKDINLYKNICSNFEDSLISKIKLLKQKNTKGLRVYSKTKCEPFLTKKNLFRSTSNKKLTRREMIMFNILYYGDGSTINFLSKMLGVKKNIVFNVAKILKKNKLIDLK